MRLIIQLVNFYFSVILPKYILINSRNILKSDVAGSPQMCLTYSKYFHAPALEICNEDVYFEVYQRPVTYMNSRD